MSDDDVQRLVVELSKRARADLAWLCETEEMNKTTAVNRAIQVYRLVIENQANGGRLIFEKDGKAEAMRIV